MLCVDKKFNVFIIILLFLVSYINNIHCTLLPSKHKRNENIKNLIIANELQLFHPENINIHNDNYLYNLNNNLNNVSYIINSVSPLLISDGDIVTVNFITNNPQTDDYIAAYSPAITNLNELNNTIPIKFGFCDENTNYLINGIGQLRFNMTNTRFNINFIYFTNGTAYPIYQNSSIEIVTFSNINAPLRPRMIATGDYNVYSLLWSSYNSTTPILKWGLTSNNYIYNSIAITDTINKTELCGAPATTYGMLYILFLNIYY